MFRRRRAQPRDDSDAPLRLARLFLASANLPDRATESQIRNTLSRSYYALFHFCNAWLAYKSIPKKKRTSHASLQRTISHHVGVEAKDRLRRFQRIREQADYTPGVLESAEFEGDLDRYRAFAFSTLEEIRSAIVDYENLIEKAKGEQTS